MPRRSPEQEQVIIAAAQFPWENRQELEYSLTELERLVATAGGTVLQSFIQKRERPEAATYLGLGKLAEIKKFIALEPKIQTIVFDNDLNPRQIKNLTEYFERKVIDRTELILDIFAARAQTREAQLEVELAQLEYLLPRLTHLWTNLSRLGGGIGTRGPGETQLELDRRRLKSRMTMLRRRIREVGQHRDVLRRSRQKKGKKVVSLIGYTNSGKSTLLQALSKKNIYSEDKLFATLDPVIRVVYLPTIKQEVLFSDTVGFIKKLPHHLVNSFKSTLEEVVYADLIIHVVDVSAADFERQIEAVYTVLHDLQAANKKIITVFNKVDLITPEKIPTLLEIYQPAVAISALQKNGLEELLKLVGEYTSSVPFFPL